MVKIWDGKLTEPVTKEYKISLCTTCMNRLKDLSVTLPFNIQNETYRAVEFILVDYNSHREDIGKWIKENMAAHLESGLLTYYRTEEPQHYSMAHSRNVAFSLGSDIVINVDADNFICPRDKPLSFCTYVNQLANQAKEKAIFAKGKRLLHGRLGFFKKDFIELGGYDEEMAGYGFDDIDLLRRAWALDYTLYWFGGTFIDRIKTPSKMKGENMKNKNWRQTEKENKALGMAKLDAGIYIRNTSITWGKANVTKNFKETIEIGNNWS